MEILKAPAYLKPKTRQWWEKVNQDYELESHHLKLLTMAAESWDICQQARQIIDREGLTFMDRFGQPKERPEVSIAANARITFARLIRELALDIEPPQDTGRPPRVG